MELSQLQKYRVNNYTPSVSTYRINKSTFRDNPFQINLSYITPRLIAFTLQQEVVEKFQKVNLIEYLDFIKQRHSNDFYIYNLTGKKIGTDNHNPKILDFDWEEHQNPPLHHILAVCKLIDDWLAQKLSNVAVINCVEGKGRSSTVICSYLIYSGFIDSVDEAIEYYNKKRLHQGGGIYSNVNRRYIEYVKQLTNDWKITPVPKYLTNIFLTGVPRFSKDETSCRPYVQVYQIYQKKLYKIYEDKLDHKIQRKYRESEKREENTIKIQIETPVVVCGDFMVRIFHNGKSKDRYICKFGANTAFIPDDQLILQRNEIDPISVATDPLFPDYFSIQVFFQEYSSCTNKVMIEKKCHACQNLMYLVKEEWQLIHKVMAEYMKHDEEENKILVFGHQTFEDKQKVLSKKPLKNFDDEEFSEILFDDDDDQNINNDDLTKTFIQSLI